MKFLILLLFFTLNAFAASGVNQNWSIAGNLQTSKNIVNGSFESGANTGWTVSAGTLTATTAQAVQGAQSGLWSITGAGTIDLCATPTNLANTDLLASGWVKSTSTELQVCSVINSIENGCTAIGSVTGWKKFQATGTYASGNFCFRLKSVASGAITAYVDDVKIEPLEFPSAATITQSWQDGTEWTSFTPTGSWTTNTTYTGKWKRDGSDLLANYSITLSGAPTATPLSVNLPSGLTIDMTKLAKAGFSNVLGTVGASRGGSGTILLPYWYTPTVIAIGYDTGSGTFGQVTNILPSPWANADEISVTIRVPIVGWSSQPTLLALPTSKDNNKTYTQAHAAITATGLSTINYAKYYPYRTISKATGLPVWRLNFELNFTTSTSVTSISDVAIAGVSFAYGTQAQQQTLYSITTSTTSRAATNITTNTIYVEAGGANTLWIIGGDIELLAKPTWCDEWVEPGVFISNINPDGFNKTSGQVGLVESFSFSFGTTNATTVCSASPCSYLDQIGNNVTSVTRSGAGVYVANLSKTFKKLKCSMPFGFGSGSVSITGYNNNGGACSNCSSIGITSVRTSTEAAIDSAATIQCQGY